MDNDDPRKEVPMTTETVDGVLQSTRDRSWTWDDLQDLPGGHRYEIIDGSLIVSAGPTPWHQLVAGELVALLRPAVPDDLAVLETVVVIGDSVLEPDVLVVRRSAITPEAKLFAPEDVLVVVEVESRSSRRFDRLAKPSVYADAGIPHYWRIDLDEQEAPTLVLCELAGSAYRMVRTVPAGESALVETPFPVQLRPADLVGPRRRG
jgi:Uma2 family endonuclease